MALTQALSVPAEQLVFTHHCRGLVYTGLIFGSGSEFTVGSLGGGGRYDNLINDLAG